MVRAANAGIPQRSAPRRRYESSIRDAQAADTRRRILDGVVATMARGLTELSIPAVARQAGVSVRTVYRHFATKAQLVDALSDHLFGRGSLEQMALPRSIEDLEPTIRELFRRLDAIDPAGRASLLTPVGWQARRTTIPRRLKMLRASAADARPELDDDARDHLARLGLILTSSFSLQAWKDYLGMNVEEAAAEVAWALRAAIAGAEKAA